MTSPTTRRRRSTALGLIAALAASGLTSTGLAGLGGPAEAVEPDPSLIASFNFDDAATGLVGAGAKATVLGSLSLVEGQDGTTAVKITRGNWLDVTKDDGTPLLAGLDDITISYDRNPTDSSANAGWALIAQRSNQTNVYQQEHYVGVLDKATSLVVERYDNVGARDSSGNLSAGALTPGWKHVDLVLDGPAARLYVDGDLKATNTTGKALSTILGASGGVLQIGKADWTASDEYFDGLIDNVEVRDQALTETQVAQLNAVQALAKVPDELTIEDSSYVLPGAEGVVSWTSQTPAVSIDADGRTATVTRPAPGSPATTGILIAQVTIDGEPRTKQVAVTITAPLTAEQMARDALDGIVLPGLQDVRSSLALPTTGAHDLPITWTSSAPSVISPTALGEAAPGVVTRPGQDQVVTLTATVGTLTRTFSAVVRAAAPAPETTDYLFAHFTGVEQTPQDEQIYFATSEDGDTWTDTRTNGNPVLRNDEGDRGVRDPYLVRSPEGDTFYLIATDLNIHLRGGWGNAGATDTGSLKLAVWKSTDLVNWGEPELVDVASQIPGAGMAWAPEAIWDPVKKQYLVYWATKSQDTNTLGDWVNVYYATTRDFETFSDPVKWIDRDHSIIDTTVIKIGDWYYRASGDGQITIEKSKNLYATTTSATAPAYVSDDQWSLVGTLSSIFGDPNFSGARLEGPEFFEYNDDDRNAPDQRLWGLLADEYWNGSGYFPFRTTDVAATNAPPWVNAKSSVNFGALKKRHGTILPITRGELDAVKAATAQPGLLVDDTPPTAQASIDPVARTATIASNDTGSGVASVEYSLDGDTWEYYTGPVVLGDDAGTLGWRVADRLGNQASGEQAFAGLQALSGPAPAIAGSARVGSSLTAVLGAWSPAPTSVTYQWLRAGRPIAGATGGSYRIVPADAGRRLSVTVTGSRAGYASTRRTSAPTAIVAPGRLTAGTVQVKGRAAPGRTLVAVVRRWGPAPVTVVYQWLRDGKVVRGAKATGYRVRRVDRGHRLSVRVTVTKAGYVAVTKVSRVVRVRRPAVQ
ncbi:MULTISPECIES: immunoglobulin-like domain-containing protein [unclassified Nocardioides]|uniref:immunoglobulin-like domain-containing protein n=1 Tax=unclassified Nocardioides TaxID=2615069 RepID=UPI00301439CE